MVVATSLGCRGECIRHSDCPTGKKCEAGSCVMNAEEIDSETGSEELDGGDSQGDSGV